MQVEIDLAQDLTNLFAPPAFGVLFLAVSHDQPAEMHVTRLGQPEFGRSSPDSTGDLGHRLRPVVESANRQEDLRVIPGSDLNHVWKIRVIRTPSMPRFSTEIRKWL